MKLDAAIADAKEVFEILNVLANHHGTANLIAARARALRVWAALEGERARLQRHQRDHKRKRGHPGPGIIDLRDRHNGRPDTPRGYAGRFCRRTEDGNAPEVLSEALPEDPDRPAGPLA